MISSRCNDTIQLDGRSATFTDLRRRLKREIEAWELFGNRVFDVWINEEAPAASSVEDSWEHCLRQVDDSDVILCLYNGNSGWAKEGGEIGICHAELHRALTMAPAKVRLIAVPLCDVRIGTDGARDSRFRDYVERQTRFRSQAEDGDETIFRCKEALFDSLIDLVHRGGREARRGKFHTGDALDWSRLDFEHRRREMRNSLYDALLERSGSEPSGNHLTIQLGDQTVLTVCHAVPASMTAPGAIDPVRQPFLKDHTLVSHLSDDFLGPIHFIACQQSATETQAVKQLGFADAILVSPPFGVYLADDTQKIQMIFIKNCRDETSVRHGVQRVFEWLSQTGEDRLLVQRAASRARIARAIAREAQ